MFPTVWNAVNTLIASVALAVAVVAAWYARKQVVLIREERARRTHEEQESIQWSARSAEVVQRLIAFIPRHTNGLNGVASGPLYPAIVADQQLRGLIESYLVRLDSGRNHVEARTLSPELLRLPIVRQTIERLEKRFAEVRKDSPPLATLASLI